MFKATYNKVLYKQNHEGDESILYTDDLNLTRNNTVKCSPNAIIFSWSFGGLWKLYFIKNSSPKDKLHIAWTHVSCDHGENKTHAHSRIYKFTKITFKYKFI